jgi:lactate dehydrogenase-like 2-hydroxyacid dehydrogenase
MKFEKTVAIGIERSKLDEDCWGKIQRLSNDFKSVQAFSTLDSSDLKTMDSLLVPLGMSITKDMMDQAPNLKYIGSLVTSFNKIDLTYTKQKGIVVTNVQGYSTNAVAEFVFGAILENIRELSRAKKEAGEGKYADETFNGSELTGKTFGVIGLGQIGTKTAIIAKGFECDVLYWSRNRKPEMEKRGIRYEELDQLLQKSDFISIHLASNSDTEGILNSKRINSIKKSAVMVNTCNLALLDSKALEKRLLENELHYITYAAVNSPQNAETSERLKQYEGYTIYPRLTYKTKEAHALRQKIFLQNMTGFLEGKVQNKVN